MKVEYYSQSEQCQEQEQMQESDYKFSPFQISLNKLKDKIRFKKKLERSRQKNVKNVKRLKNRYAGESPLKVKKQLIKKFNFFDSTHKNIQIYSLQPNHSIIQIVPTYNQTCLLFCKSEKINRSFYFLHYNQQGQLLGQSMKYQHHCEYKTISDHQIIYFHQKYENERSRMLTVAYWDFKNDKEFQFSYQLQDYSYRKCLVFPQKRLFCVISSLLMCFQHNSNKIEYFQYPTQNGCTLRALYFGKTFKQQQTNDEIYQLDNKSRIAFVSGQNQYKDDSNSILKILNFQIYNINGLQFCNQIQLQIQNNLRKLHRALINNFYQIEAQKQYFIIMELKASDRMSRFVGIKWNIQRNCYHYRRFFKKNIQQISYIALPNKNPMYGLTQEFNRFQTFIYDKDSGKIVDKLEINKQNSTALVLAHDPTKIIYSKNTPSTSKPNFVDLEIIVHEIQTNYMAILMTQIIISKFLNINHDLLRQILNILGLIQTKVKNQKQ